jgi:hypothetical protein
VNVCTKIERVGHTAVGRQALGKRGDRRPSSHLLVIQSKCQQLEASLCFSCVPVPTENSVQPMGNIIPPAGLRRSSILRPCLSLVEETRRRRRLQGSIVETQKPMAQGVKARGVLESGFSGSPSFVAVVQSTNLRHRHDGSHLRRLNRPWLR